MTRRAQLFVLVLLSTGTWLIFTGGAAAHADGGELTVSIVSIDDSDFPTVRAVLNVDQGELPLQGLTAEQVEAAEGGLPASVHSLDAAFDSDLPIALILVIDTSGSVAGDLIAEVQTAATELIGELGPQDSIALITFSDKVTIAQTLTTDHQDAIDAVTSIEAIGNTALYDAVGAASALAAAADVSRAAIVILSDGAEYGGLSAATRESSIEGASGGAPFYVVGVGDFVDQAYLEEIADRSGGRYFSAGTVAEIGSVYAAIEELLRAQYVVTLESADDPNAHTSSLTVTVTVGDQTASDVERYEAQRPVAPAPIAPTPQVHQPVATAPPVETEPVPATPEESSSNLPLVGGISATIVMVVLGLVLIRRRRRTPDLVVPESIIDRRPLRWDNMTVQPTEVLGYLVPLTGDALEGGLSLGDGPITIGTAEDCRAQVDGAPEVAKQHARIWLRDSRPMLHHVADGFETRLNGQAVGWAALHDGDEIVVGPYRFRFVDHLDESPVAPREVSA